MSTYNLYLVRDISVHSFCSCLMTLRPP